MPQMESELGLGSAVESSRDIVVCEVVVVGPSGGFLVHFFLIGVPSLGDVVQLGHLRGPVNVALQLDERGIDPRLDIGIGLAAVEPDPSLAILVVDELLARAVPEWSRTAER